MKRLLVLLFCLPTLLFAQKNYTLEIVGKNLLISVDDEKAQDATLFVRYGEERTTYVAVIYPDDKAPPIAL